MFYCFVRDKLVNYWRKWLTNNYLDTYFRNAAFYKLAFNADIDNPDHGGIVTAVSKPEAGSTFRFSLPTKANVSGGKR